MLFDLSDWISQTKGNKPLRNEFTDPQKCWSFRFLTGQCGLQLLLYRSPDEVGFADLQFASMGLKPLEQLKCGHDIQGHDNAVGFALDVLRVVQRLACEVLREQGVCFKNNLLGCSLAQHGDAECVCEVVLGMEQCVHLEF